MLVVGPEEGAGTLYQPGDHVGVLPANSPTLVAALISRLHSCPSPDDPVQVLLQRRQKATGGAGSQEPCWSP